MALVRQVRTFYIVILALNCKTFWGEFLKHKNKDVFIVTLLPQFQQNTVNTIKKIDGGDKTRKVFRVDLALIKA